jgi:hypothetical protein
MPDLSSRTQLSLLLFVLATVAFAAFGFASVYPAAERVTLPVKVMGPDGHVTPVSVDVQNARSVDSLYLKTHSIGYPRHYIETRGYTVSKASVRLNGGGWVDLDNDVAQCKLPASQMGCITGPMHTIRFEVAISDLGTLTEGGNRIEFRFNYTDEDDRNAEAPGDPSTGYRILDLELRDAADTDHVDGTTLQWDDPSSWTAPANYEGAAPEGKELWHQRDLLVDYPGGPDITASCADCHADDGRDLAYFAYSNRSIVARSQFHGLTKREGKKIAAYVRSLTLKDPDTGQSYDPPGRPWHPPYQPGPTAVATRADDAPRTTGEPFGAISSQYWAAGAGVEWSLDRDRESLPHFFPDGVSLDDVHPDSSLNVRAMPIALQLPDWNEWLPEQHPIDLYGSKFETAGDPGAWETYAQSTNKNDFQDVRGCMDNQQDGADCVGKAASALNWFTRITNEHRNDLRLSSEAEVPDHEADYSLMRWMAVKQWELLHTHDLMDHARDAYADAAPLQWPVPHRSLFNHASHIISADLKGEKYGTHDLYFDTAWYELQVIVNSGQGISTGAKPVDWKYQFSHINSGLAGWPLRYLRSYVRLIQNANGSVQEQFQGDKYPEGWYLRHTQLGRLDRFPANELNQYRAGLKEEVLTTITRAWTLGAIEGNDWTDACRDGGQWCIEPASTEPEFITAWQPSQEKNYANTTYSTVAFLRDEGVDPSALAPLRDWGASLWPNATDPTWDELLDESTLPVELANFAAEADGEAVILTWATASETNNAGFEVQHRPPDGSAFSKIHFVDGAGTTTEPRFYRVRVDDLAAGRHRFRLRQVDTDGSSHTTDPVTVRVAAERALTLQAPAPNPVRHSTRLPFTVRQDGRATAFLYDVLGQRVRILVEGPVQVGREHEIEISARGLSAGTYFVRLRAPTGTRTRRITIVR